MFKIGDKVMCVDAYYKDYISPIDSQRSSPLLLYETYTIIIVLDDIGVEEKMGYLYNRNRFKLLTDIRKEKLHKLCSK